MDSLPYSNMDMPATYRVRVHGCPSLMWVEAMLGEVMVETERIETRGQTTYTAEMADQAALLGFINALYNLGYAVISVEQIASDEQPPSNDVD